MEIDEEKVGDAVLALLRLTLHDGQRAWEGGVRLGHARASAPLGDDLRSRGQGKAKSVVLTDEGLRRAEERLAALFAKIPDA